MTPLPLIACSIGDPAGIGPEVILKALADPALRARARWVLCGNHAPLLAAQQACAAAGHASVGALSWRTVASTALAALAAAPPAPGEIVLLEHAPARDVTHFPATSTPRPTADGGAASLAYVRAAIALARDADIPPAWRAHAVVTAPISKEAWVLAGESRFPGHTELFAHEFASPHAAMMFAVAPAGPHRPGLHVILATAHVPLAAVPRTLTTARITEVILLGARAMRDLGVPDPRVGVCGLNPHAGERGVLGPEDDAIIAPAIAQARAQGVNASGPFPGDTIFPGVLAYATADTGAPTLPRAPRFDLVVAMYHDQGLIPVKLLAFDRAVNVTVGLRWQGRDVVRTSPDHGTAYDIAGRGIADAGSMRAAMDLAITWAARANDPAAPAPRKDVNALRGTLTLTEEPIDFQRRMRGGPLQPPHS